MYNKKNVFSFEIFSQVPYDPPMSPHAQQYFGASGRFESLRPFQQNNRFGSPQPDMNVPHSYQTSGKYPRLKMSVLHIDCHTFVLMEVWRIWWSIKSDAISWSSPIDTFHCSLGQTCDGQIKMSYDNHLYVYKEVSGKKL